MPKTKIAITLDHPLLVRLDRLVEAGHFPNRSQAIEGAIVEKLDRLDRRRLAAECAKLDPAAEKAAAEEGLGVDVASWPTY
ncbi:MAG: ribbon-helix-helix domain-containing protein [Gemmatimonadota bacterium]